jgi:PPOX class probable F420-dependent enzyme
MAQNERPGTRDGVVAVFNPLAEVTVPVMASPFPDSHADLLAAPVTAFITTMNADGSMHSSAVWFLATDTDVSFSVVNKRKKAVNAMARPQVCLSVLDPANPWKWISIAGTASVEPDDDRVFMREIGAKHNTDVSGYDAPGAVRVRVRITPTRVLTQG